MLSMICIHWHLCTMLSLVGLVVQKGNIQLFSLCHCKTSRSNKDISLCNTPWSVSPNAHVALIFMWHKSIANHVHASRWCTGQFYLELLSQSNGETSYSRIKIIAHIVVWQELKAKSAIGFINAYPVQSIKRPFLKIPWYCLFSFQNFV